MYKHLFFDLDGTITDSFLGITQSVDHALRTVCGIETDDLRSLTAYIGPPLVDGFMQNHSLNRETAEQCKNAYRARYEKGGLFENEVYPGVETMLSTLKAEGYHLYIATSKPERFAKRILAYFGLMQYFERITGASMDGKINQKHEVIAEALRLADIQDKSTCLMIGDRHHDMQGGVMNGIATLGITYGFGDREELEQAGANGIVGCAVDIIGYVHGKQA